MKNVIKSVKKHKKSIIVLFCALVISTLIYTNTFNLSGETPVSDYLYSKDLSGEGNVKILGEATLVDSNASGEGLEDSYFANAQINRERSRDEALETLQVVVDSSESLPEMRDKALGEIMQIASDIETEATVEEMIRAKGFDDCVAIISGQNINVIVKSEGLLTSEVAQITDIVKNETGFEAKNIRIVEKV